MSQLTRQQVQRIVSAMWRSGERLGSGGLDRDQLRLRALALIAATMHADQDAFYDLVGSVFVRVRALAGKASSSIQTLLRLAQATASSTADRPPEVDLSYLRDASLGDASVARRAALLSRATSDIAAASFAATDTRGTEYKRLISLGEEVSSLVADIRDLLGRVVDAERSFRVSDLPRFRTALLAEHLGRRDARAGRGAIHAAVRASAVLLMGAAEDPIDLGREKVPVVAASGAAAVIEGSPLPCAPTTPETANFSDGASISAPAASPAELVLRPTNPVVISCAGAHIGVTGDGATTIFGGRSTKQQSVPGTFRAQITDVLGRTVTIVDDGAGGLSDAFGGSGAIYYSSGAFNYTFSSAPSAGATLSVSVDAYLFVPGDTYLVGDVLLGLATSAGVAVLGAPATDVADLAVFSAAGVSVAESDASLVITSDDVGTGAVVTVAPGTFATPNYDPSSASRWVSEPTTIFEALGCFGQARGTDVVDSDLTGPVTIRGERGQATEVVVPAGGLSSVECDLPDALLVEVLSPFSQVVEVASIVDGIASVSPPIVPESDVDGFVDTAAVLRCHSIRASYVAAGSVEVALSGIGFSGRSEASSNKVTFTNDDRYRVRPGDLVVRGDTVDAVVVRATADGAVVDTKIVWTSDHRVVSPGALWSAPAADELLSMLPAFSSEDAVALAAGGSSAGEYAQTMVALSAFASRARSWAQTLGVRTHAPTQRLIAALEADGLAIPAQMLRDLRFSDLVRPSAILAGYEDVIRGSAMEYVAATQQEDVFTESFSRPETDDG